MTDHERLQTAAHDHLLLHFSRNGAALGPDGDLLVLERGEGPYVFDTRGKRYIDALSSLFCAQIGYSFGEEMAAAAASQMTRLAFNTNWGTAHPAAIELAEKLAEVMPGDLNHAFFTSGGSESVEAMWKIAREHFIARGEARRTKAIARHIAYHGVTLGALSFTGVPGMKDPFSPPPIDVTHVSNTNAFRLARDGDLDAFRDRLLDGVREAVEAAGADEVAVIIAEPIQNAGGCLVPPPGYWQGLRDIADECGALLVADEVICGFGRMGEWLGIERENVVPDIATTAKGLTSAYAAMGAVLVRDHVAESLHGAGVTLRHGITFGGHPVSAAVALRNIEVFEREGVFENVRANEPYLAEKLDTLRELPIVGDVRGRGFFWAVELVKDENDTPFDADERERLLRGFMPGRLREAGIIARADDRGDAVVQIAPPLISDRDLLDDIVAGLGDVFTDAGEFMQVSSSSSAQAV